MRTPAAVLLSVLALAFAACGGSATADGPPTIAYGRDVCDHCHMIITDARYAAGYTTSDGIPRRFDDLADLVAFGRGHGELDSASVWVHDVGTEAWVAAPEAWFVVGSSPATPMGSGLVAFVERSHAEAHAHDHGGSVRTWDELRRPDPIPGDPPTSPLHEHDTRAPDQHTNHEDDT